MSDILKKPYEISVWRDVLNYHIQYSASGVEEDVKVLPDATEVGAYSVVYQYYKEEKVAVIGSSNMRALTRARDPILTGNINGTSSLNFSISYKYYDDELHELRDNPFVALLSNETKIKLLYGEDKDENWHDFIIKNISENSETYTFTYECSNLYINELSKNGFGLEFKTELFNNQGTIIELGERVLAETDWEVNKEESDVIQQKIEEPLYRGKLKQNITARNMEDGSEIQIASGKYIYIFYSCITNAEPYLQFLYDSDGYKTDSDRIIVDVPNYSIGVTYDTSKVPNMPNICDELILSDDYRGERLVRKQLAAYDAYTDMPVNIYEKQGDSTHTRYYGYEETEFPTATSVTDLVANGSTFTNTNGWIAASGVSALPKIFPEVSTSITPQTLINTYLNVQFGSTTNWIINSGIKSMVNYLPQGFSAGDTYILRTKYSVKNGDILTDATRLPVWNLNAKVQFYTSSTSGQYEFPDTYVISGVDGTGTVLNFSSWSIVNGYLQATANCARSVSNTDLRSISNKFGLVFRTSDANIDYYFEDVQLFKKETNLDGTIIYPGDIPTVNARTIYKFYKPSTKYESIEDVIFDYIGTSPSGGTNSFIPVYSDTYEKITSIEVEQSNRFNIIQELCEGFEAWADFRIHHWTSSEIEELGVDAIPGQIKTLYTTFKRLVTDKERAAGPILGRQYYIYDSIQHIYKATTVGLAFDPTINYYYDSKMPRQQKEVVFKKFIGQDNFAGFRAGINLKSIDRTINSDQLVTKLIVQANQNEAAVGGYCDIQAAKANLEGTSYLLNLDYYVNQGLINSAQLNNDLYASANNSQGYIAYYARLRAINQGLATVIGEQAAKEIALTRLKADQTRYQAEIDATTENIADAKLALNSQTQTSYENLISINILDPAKRNEMLVNDEVKKILTKILTWQNSLILATIKLTECESAITATENRLEELVTIQETAAARKQEIDKEFYHKYSRYIQEGTWSDDKYYDDDLYYLDAKSVLYTSSRPEVQYNINVLELSEIEEYKNYSFKVGDKTYIEDTEFFGWTIIDGVKTPYKEQIVVSEVKNFLDDPSANTITVQNYKTQFEDLFQRITATTQSLQYAMGSYNRAAAIVNPDGTINANVLQNTIASNNLAIYNAAEQSVTLDDKGITIENLSNPAEVLRIVSGGVLISRDGGVNWTAGMTASGFNAAFLTGKLNTTQVMITSSDSRPSIIWNSEGLTAYKHILKTEDGEIVIIDGEPVVDYYDYSTFLRLDQYGIYGIKEYPDAGTKSFLAGSIKDIEDTAQFGLTWNGFFLKSDDNNGLVKISNTDDIQVFAKHEDEFVERIKLGKINDIGSNDLYGLNIKDNNGHTVMRTASDGLLFLERYMRIGPNVSAEYSDRVKLGIIQSYDANDTEVTDLSEAVYSKVLSVIGTDSEITETPISEDETLVIFDNGLLYAANAKITGEINATSGVFDGITVTGASTIGSLTVESITNSLNDYNNNYGPTGYLRVALDGVYQGIQNNTLNFTSAGLDMSVFKEIDVTASDFDALKSSLYKKEDNEYTPVGESEAYNPNQTYYILEKVFYVDENGQLQITGNLNAASGSFTGTINATNGSIGGITISDGSISAGGIDGFSINQDGSIVANNITLGNNITITNGIVFTKDGEWTAGVYNPNNNDNCFIKIEDGDGNTTYAVYADGYSKVGSIILDGITSSISSSSYNGNVGWRLDEEEAIFNNITARGTLSATTFSKGEVQAVGGTMFIRPTSSIEEFEFNIEEHLIYLTIKDDLDTFFDAADDDSTRYALIGHSNLLGRFYSYKINRALNRVELKPVPDRELNISGLELSSRPFIDLGVAGSTCIGLNSANKVGSGATGSLVPPQAVSVMTVEEIKDVNDEVIGVTLVSRAIMGSIPNSTLYGPNRKEAYGFYSSNVYIHGAIVAKNLAEQNNCAGLNTTSEVNWADDFASLYFPEAYSKNQIGKIILWAGAASESAEDIRDAHFKVDTFGNMYANSGYFEGTIITKATITASELRTATITGWSDGDGIGTGEEAALTIKNASKGINFKSDDNTVFSVGKDGVKINDIPLDVEYVFLHRPTIGDPYGVLMDEKGFNFIQVEYREGEEIYSLESPKLVSIYYSLDNYKLNGDEMTEDYWSLKIGKDDRDYISFGRLPNSNYRNSDYTGQLENKSLLRFNVNNEFVLGEVSEDSTSQDYGREVMFYQKAMVDSRVEGYNLFILKE